MFISQFFSALSCRFMMDVEMNIQAIGLNTNLTNRMIENLFCIHDANMAVTI